MANVAGAGMCLRGGVAVAKLGFLRKAILSRAGTDMRDICSCEGGIAGGGGADLGDGGGVESTKSLD